MPKGYVKKVPPCQSPLPRPEVKVCPIGGCQETIADNHWACMLHWERLPAAMRFYGNIYKNHWAGDPGYDDFIAKANKVNAEIEHDIDTTLERNPDLADLR